MRTPSNKLGHITVKLLKSLSLFKRQQHTLYTLKITKNIQTTAKRVLNEEASAILKSCERININFEQCVLEILQSKGRLVVTGIGKSAIVANKIVATMNSTGTPAVFMHAADAIHGDLGIIQPDDMVLCISKSGNTPEIKVLVPMLKRLGSKLIALVSNVDSYLAKQADYILDGTIDKEACPLNLAPTTSTTLHLALGDALAVCLLEEKGFGNEDFAKLHPGGSLGKQLYLKVENILAQNEKPVVSESANLTEVIMEISSKRLGATAVVDERGSLKGIITDGDLRRAMQKHENIQNLKAEEIMTANPKSIEKTAYAVEAFALMQANNITQLIAVDGLEIAGFVHIHDLLKEGIV
jgi:arabinose-5-phosphate isomerase